MFHPIEIPFGSKMLFNVVDLKDGMTIEDVELLLGEMCNIVKNNYGDDNGGFVGGQVFRNAGFISKEGSHADELFNDKFAQLAEYCDNTFEVGYDMLWQGITES